MNATCILSADLHFRTDSPKARTDDFQKALWAKWKQICDLSIENDSCPILVAGDIGHKAEWSNELLEKFILSVSEPNIGKVFVIPGQHDVKNHSLALWKESGIGVLEAAEAIDLLLEGNRLLKEQNVIIYSFPWGVPITPPGSSKSFKIVMTHQMVIEGNTEEWPGQIFTGAKALLKKHKDYDILLSGDNHKPFAVEHDGRWLINPGSMMRTTANQISHRPRVYLYYAEGKYVEPYYLKIKRGVISREHIEQQQAREKRMEALIASVKSNREVKFSYEGNMEDHLAENPAEKGVKTKIWKSMENPEKIY